jgi:uncharacterized protein with beta-barrel porin domain
MAISCFFVAGGASADCGAPGATVSCTGADADGFDAGSLDGIDLTVEDEMPEATVDGGGNTEAIRLNDDSSVTNDGQITLATDDGATVSMGDNATITNNDTITATGSDSRAMEVGDGATITNNSGGVITGGSDGTNNTGYAIWFNGSAAAAENSLTSAGGTITTADGVAGVAIEGSEGNETILLQADSSTTGDIRTNGGDDLVRLIGSGATLDGNVFLGEGDDRFDLNGMTTTYTGNVDGGNGSNMFIVTGAGATWTGDYTGGDDDDTVFIFQDTTVNSNNQFNLGAGDDELNVEGGGATSFDFDVTGGAGNDVITFEFDVDVTDTTVSLGADDDTIEVQDGATVGGAFDLGGGSDTVEIDGDLDVMDMSGATFTGNVDLGQGVDAAGDTNTLTIGINATLNGDVLGGDGADDLSLLENATVTGQLNLGAGDDDVSVGKGADIGGAIDLGAGDDVFILQEEADLDLMGGTLMAGDGNDTVSLRGPNDLANDTQSTLTGNVNLGGAGLDFDNDLNTLRLQSKTTLDGTVTGGAQVDRIELNEQTTITGAVNLGAGPDEFYAGIDSTLESAIDLGDGENFLQAGEGAVFESTVDLGADDDRVELLFSVTTEDDVRTGDGNDTVVVSNEATVMGDLDLGDGDDVLELRPTGTVPANLILGAGSDALQLDAEAGGSSRTGVADLTAIQTARGADTFERLIIGPGDAADDNPPFNWLVATTAPTAFADGIVVSNGAVVFEGTVELTGDVNQTQNTILVFDLGVDVDDGALEIDGMLTIDASDFGDAMDPDDDLVAGAEVTINGNIVEDTYTLISATGGINRVYTDEEFTTPDIAAFTFAHQLNGNALELVVERVSTFDDFANNGSQGNLGRYLERARVAAGTSAFSDFSADLDMLSESDLQTALSQLGAEPYDAHTSSMISWGRAQRRVLHARPMHCERFTYAPRPEVVSANPCGQRGLMPWAQVVGDISNHKGDDDRGFDSLGGGVLMGVDHRASDRYWWSADIGFGHVEIDNDNDADGQFQTVDLGVAAGAVFAAFQTRGSVTYSHGFHEIDRRVDFISDTLRGKFDSDRVTVAVEGSYRARVGPVVLEPGVKVDFTHVTEESLDEKGHDVAALEVHARKTNLFTAAGGLSISTALLKYRYVGDWLEWADGVWTPMVSAHWRQGFGDVDRDVTAALSGADSSAGDFDSEARDSNGGVEVRGGVTFQPLENAASVGIHYDGYFGDDVINHSANASVRIPF